MLNFGEIKFCNIKSSLCLSSFITIKLLCKRYLFSMYIRHVASLVYLGQKIFPCEAAQGFPILQKKNILRDLWKPRLRGSIIDLCFSMLLPYLSPKELRMAIRGSFPSSFFVHNYPVMVRQWLIPHWFHSVSHRSGPLPAPQQVHGFAFKRPLSEVNPKLSAVWWRASESLFNEEYPFA